MNENHGGVGFGCLIPAAVLLGVLGMFLVGVFISADEEQRRHNDYLRELGRREFNAAQRPALRAEGK